MNQQNKTKYKLFENENHFPHQKMNMNVVMKH